MKKEEKNQAIEELVNDLSSFSNFYLTDISNLTVEKTNSLRRTCFKKEVKLKVVKNTLLKKALERTGHNFDAIYPLLHGSTSIMYTNSLNEGAKLIKEFRKTNEKPILKGAYVQESIFVGDNQLDTLVAIKSKEDLLGELIGLLQSPARNVISALQSGGQKISGILKTLEERKS